MLIEVIRIRTPQRYTDAWDLQKAHGAEVERNPEPHAKLLLLQHLPVFTLGRTVQPAHLLGGADSLAARTGADVIVADRGGSVTYHAPGQCTAYLLLHLQRWKLSIHEHLYKLEEVAIRTVARFGLQGRREEGMTGVWVGEPRPGAKICAVGVSARRWVTYHGLSLNVDIDLTPFAQVIPCGLEGKAVTSLSLAQPDFVCVSDVEEALRQAFGEVYQARTETGMV